MIHFLLPLLLYPIFSLTSTPPLSCILHQSAVRCRNTSLDRIADALLILFPLSNGTEAVLGVTGPEKVDISDCGVVSLPNLFTRFNGSIRAVRVASSGLHYVAVNAFTGLEEKLRQLDLSGNALQTVPQALQGLAALEELDLSDNLLHKADGSFLLHARGLRTLRLAYNLLGGEGGAGLKTTSTTPKAFRTTIGFDVLDLRSIGSSLEYLDLSDNWFHALPEVLRGPTPTFQHLRHLMLNHNRLADVPADVFDVAPELQALHLDANLVRTIKFNRLPPSLKLFSLQENPLQCDCSIMWLLELIQRNASVTLRLPPCATPFYVRELTLSNLYDATLCSRDETEEGKRKLKSPSQVVYVNDRDLGFFHLGLFQAMHLLDITPKTQGLFATWKVDLDFYSSSFNWTLIIRPINAPIYSFADTPFKPDKYKTPSSGGEGASDAGAESIYSGTIWGLDPNQFYIVCMAAVENEVRYVHLNQCKGATPLNDGVPVPPNAGPTPTTTTPTTTSHGPTTPTLRPRPALAPMNLRAVASSPTAINVTWSGELPGEEEVDPPGPASPLDLDVLFARPPNKWTLLWRPFAETRAFSSVGVAEPKHQLKGLEPGRGYYVCLRPRFEDREGEEEEEEDAECTEVRTAPADRGGFTAGAVAAAGILATCATAALAVAVVCCCQPDRRSCASPPQQSDAASNDGTVQGVFLRTPRSGRRLTAPTLYPLATNFDIPTGESSTADTPVDAGTPTPTDVQPEPNGHPLADLNANRTAETKT